MFVYELSGSAFESNSSHLNFRFHAGFQQGISWRSGNYGVWIHSETRTWHDKNIQSNARKGYVLRTELSHLGSLAKWFTGHLRNKWFWFESSCSHLNFISFRVCGHSSNCKVLVHFEKHTLQGKKIESNAPYRYTVLSFGQFGWMVE